MYATLRPCEVKDVRYAARAVKDVRFTVLLVMCTVVARPDLAELRAVRFVYPLRPVRAGRAAFGETGIVVCSATA